MTRTLTGTIRRVATILTLTLLALAGSTAVAGAADTMTVVAPGLSTTGATAAPVDGSVPRQFTSTQSASMMQPLLAAMYYGTPQYSEPPATATRYVITYDYVFTNDDPDSSGTMTLNYATQGSTGWVSFPAQPLWPGSAITAETADKWFVLSQSFVAGFNDQGTVKTFAIADSGTTTKSSSDVSSGLIVVVMIVAVVLLGGIYAITQRRRSNS